MPAFTALGTYVATAILGAAAAGTFAFVAISSVVAIGAAYVTSRLINGNQNKGGLDAGAASQGGRIQVPPATNNKIPVVYGQAFVNGIITDAWLTTTDQKKNDIMYYCLVLSETCNMVGAEYTLDDVYWGDLRLVFESGAGDQHKVLKGVKTVDGPGEDFENTDFKIDGTNYVEMRVYAGNSGSAQQIFPLQSTSNTANAYDYWPDSQWTSANQMEGLVFAIVKLKYNAEKGFTNLPTITFKLTNNKANPAQVWHDYMTSRRYGAGVDPASIPVGAGSEYEKWFNYCEEQIRYTDKDSTSTLQKRYQINGVIDTSNSVKSNIDSLVQNGGAWLSYDVVTGQWKPIIKKAVSAGDPTDLLATTHFTASISGSTMTVTAFPEGRIEAGQALYRSNGTFVANIVGQAPLAAGEQAGQIGTYTISGTASIASTTFYTKATGLLQFDDDNIISGINISSTRLDDLYNKYEVEFFDKYNRDQRAYARDELPSLLRNPQEPDNQLRLGLEFTNNSVQANILGNIELRQSRDDLVIEFTASHYGIQAQAGDIIEITNSIYGWAPKLFRVMRVKEIETEEGALIVDIQALEYNGDVYTIENITEFTTEENIGIAPIRAGGANGSIQTPANDRVSIVETNNTAAVPYIVLAVEIPSQGGPYDSIEVWYAESPTATVPPESAYTRLMTHKPPPPESVYDNGRTITVTSITGGDTLNTATAHGLSAGQQLLFASATTNGLTENKGYWVLSSGLTTTAFKLALTENGTPITLTNGTGLTIALQTCHLIYMTQLPANQTGQKYFFRVRVGAGGYYSGFTDPDVSLPITDPTTPWNPYGGGAGFDLSGAVEGDVIYYDATTTLWKKTSLLQINDTTNNVIVANDLQLKGGDILSLSGMAAIGVVNDDATVFGDLRVAGNDIKSSTATAITLSGADVTVVGDLSITGGDIKSGGIQFIQLQGAGSVKIQNELTVNGNNINSSTAQAITLSGNDVTVVGDLTVTGNDIKSSTATAITLSGTDVAVAGNLTVNGGYIKNGALNHIQLQGLGDVKIIGNLILNSNTINSSGNVTAITTSGADVAIAGDLTVTGNDIKSSSGTTAITLSGTDVAIAGNLTVNGTTTTLNTQNVLVEDNILTLNYGQVSPVLNAGIEVDRGTGNFVPVFRWNESNDRWDFTNDGTNYITLPNQSLDTTSSPTFAGVTAGNIQVGITNDNEIDTSTGNLTIDSAGGTTTIDDELIVAGDVRINGNDIKSSTGATAITLSATNAAIAGDLTVNGGYIKNGALNHIQLQGLGDVKVIGNLILNNNTINSSGNVTAITTSGTDVAIAGDLRINGNDIQASDGTTNITLTSNTLTTFAGDIRINGNDIQNSAGNTVITFAGTNANFAGAVSVGSSLQLPNSIFVSTGTLTTTTTTANQTLDTLGKDFFGSAVNTCIKYLVRVKSGSEFQCVEILVVHDGTTAYHTVYADVKTGAELATFNVTISGSTILLRTTPTNASTVYTFKRELMF